MGGTQEGAEDPVLNGSCSLGVHVIPSGKFFLTVDIVVVTINQDFIKVFSSLQYIYVHICMCVIIKKHMQEQYELL